MTQWGLATSARALFAPETGSAGMQWKCPETEPQEKSKRRIMSRIRFSALWIAVILLVLESNGALAQDQGIPIVANNQTFEVELLKPVSTQTSKKGDPVNAIVRTPAQFEGSEMTGVISRMKVPKKGFSGGRAELVFGFNTLHFNGQAIPVHASLVEVTNSKGVKGVDEEGRVIGKSSSSKRAKGALGGAMAGALLGAVLQGGASGAFAGAAAGAAAGFIVASTMTAKGENIDFQKGSHFTLDVRQSGAPVAEPQQPAPAAEPSQQP